MDEKTIYALGFFDGVHIGHGALLTACRDLADRLGCRAGAITFTSHPLDLVLGKGPGLISTIQDRKLLMQSLYHIDTIVALPFDRATMTMHWHTFFRMLLSKYGAAGLVCGHDFRFGNRGEGTPQLLQEACREAGIPCIVVPEQRIDGITVSSTYIRSLIEQGDMARAARFLGHPHIFTGMVVPGNHLGSTLGFPTANLLLPAALLHPRKGVYACLARLDGARFPAVTNVGTRPTVGGTHMTVEAWLLNFSGDLYGREITLEFHQFLRDEQKFPSLEDLQREIQKNAAQTLEFFQKL